MQNAESGQWIESIDPLTGEAWSLISKGGAVLRRLGDLLQNKPGCLQRPRCATTAS